MRKKKILLAGLALTLGVFLVTGIPGFWPAWAASGYYAHKQYLPQILVDYCVSYPAIQPNDIDKDKEVEARINNIRIENGLPTLTQTPELTQAALRHSNDMSENSFFGHTGSDGSRAGQRMEDACYHWQAYGEIIAKGYETPAEVIAGWMDSPGHQGVILSELFEEFGAGFAYDANGDDRYWTVDFGLRAGELNLTAESYYSCTYYLGGEERESWLSVSSIWSCGAEEQEPTALNE